MKDSNVIKGLAAQISEQCSAREQIEQEIERIEGMAESVRKHDEAIADLKQQRKAILTRTVLHGGKADTGTIDKELARLTKASEAEIAKSEAISDAIEILRGRVAEADDKIFELVQQQRATLRTHLDERYTAVEERYASAVDALGAVLCELSALERLRASDLCSFPGAKHVSDPATQLLESLFRDGGLRVPHRFSYCTVDEYWPWDGGPKAQDGVWERPTWLPDPTKAKKPRPDADAERMLREEMRELGVDLEWPSTPKAPAAVNEFRFSPPTGVSVQTIEIPHVQQKVTVHHAVPEHP